MYEAFASMYRPLLIHTYDRRFNADPGFRIGCGNNFQGGESWHLAPKSARDYLGSAFDVPSQYYGLLQLIDYV